MLLPVKANNLTDLFKTAEIFVQYSGLEHCVHALFRYRPSGLIKAKTNFGEYTYYDKDSDEVMDVNSLVRDLKRLPIDKMRFELKHLATRTDCPLEPELLLRSILGSLDDNEDYNTLFEDEELCQYYN